MATIIVEDGTIVANANSYVTEADLASYAADRGITITGDPSELLVRATDYLETLKFIGARETRDQPLEWPRIGVIIDGFNYLPTEIPEDLKQGQMEVALSIDSGIDPLAPIERSTKKEVVGPIEVEYMDNSVSSEINPKINAYLSKLIVGGSTGGIQFVVSRG